MKGWNYKMPKKKKEEAKVKIDDTYYFMIDGRSMALYRKGSPKAVGYYTSWELMMRRIIYLNSVDEANKKGVITIQEYLDLIVRERKKVAALFQNVLNVSGALIGKVE
jgi:hypothetical protein